MSNEKLLLIVNPKSGLGLTRLYLMDMLDLMIKAGYDVTTYITQARGDARRKVKEDGAGYDRIICSGGDGTLDEVVTGMREAELSIPLGYVPAGSTNDFANSLGLPGDMIKATKVAVGKKSRLFDVGKFNEDTFVYIAAFGIFTEISYETPQELKNILGHMAYILSAAKSLASIPNYPVKVIIDGKETKDSFIYGMITNSTSVAGFHGLTGKDVKLDDGEFEVILIKGPNNPIELNEILGFLTGVIPKTQMVVTYKTKEIRIESEEEIPWTLDGEFGGNHKAVDIRNLHKKVELIVEKQR